MFDPCFVLGVLSRFGIILMRKRAVITLLKLYSWCLVTVSVLWLLLAVICSVWLWYFLVTPIYFIIV